MALTDHSDLMGIATDIKKSTLNIPADKKGKEWYEGLQKGGKAAGEAAFDLVNHFAQMTLPEQLVKDYSLLLCKSFRDSNPVLDSL